MKCHTSYRTKNGISKTQPLYSNDGVHWYTEDGQEVESNDTYDRMVYVGVVFIVYMLVYSLFSYLTK